MATTTDDPRLREPLAAQLRGRNLEPGDTHGRFQQDTELPTKLSSEGLGGILLQTKGGFCLGCAVATGSTRFGAVGLSALQSPQMSSGVMNPIQAQQGMLPHQAQMMPGGQPGFQPPVAHQQPPVGQSPMRGMAPARPDLMHQRSNPALAGGTPQPPGGPYGYPTQPQHMWGQPPPQPQPSPLSAGPQGVGMPQYAPQLQQQQQQQSPSPMAHSMPQQHPSQSPRNQPRPSVPQMPQSFPMHHPQTSQQQPMSMGFPGVTGAPYPGMAARAMYPSTQGPGGQPFMAGTPQQGMAMGMSAGGMPGWAPAPSGPVQPGHPQPGQSGTPLGWSGY
ncbi:predicted protein [Aspergillus terreus NIH2624]|uniref:Uncharacterized protein n=1 Tax=Aspergillus terreus (strain NIH 2624 / FGSC A1156) TaxID=341663 RepID=Q0D1D3_ASPTN|nr:uncharacterized protein ATEG_00251 [Aspergillus terreus NIH2624]EAU38897.1 predicted protein [Aspergillus terreus NIH2624]